MRKLHLALAATFAVASPALAQTAPVVKTMEGSLSGASEHGVTRFLGVHYGADTGGENRFRAPRPVQPWQGVKAADRMGDRCPQPDLGVGANSIISFSNLPVSEDCLVLNVWTPSLKKGAKRPVMLWLHGGAFGFGSASDKYYDGAELARRQGVVVVSINHRLNGFGYLDLGPEAKGDFDANPGQLDIVAALEWVKRNIARFGGNPGNVTLFGQSGGGGKISVLLAMPAAKGLFHKAIIESGADLKVATEKEALGVRDKVFAKLALKPADYAKLRKLPLADLMKAFGEKADMLSYHPFPDGEVLPGNPFDPAAPAISANVPLMVGTARDEGTVVLLSDPGWPKTDDTKLTMFASMLSSGKVKEAIDLYKARSPQDKPMHLLASIMTDSMFTINAMTLAERKAAQPAKVYAYRIDWHTPVQGGVLRSPHGVELPFVFGTVPVSEELVGKGPSQDRMTSLLMGTFAAFARTGNPNIKGVPLWKPYDAKTRATFIYNDPPSVVNDPDPALRLFWTKVKGY